MKHEPIPYYVKALLMAIPALLIGIQIPSWLVLIPSLQSARQSDFRVFYTPGYMLRKGNASEIYSLTALRRVEEQIVASDRATVPFLHPSYEILLFAPLTYLPFHSAYLVWAGVNLLIIVLIYWLLRPRLQLLESHLIWLPAALLLAFVPIPFALMAGQDSLLLLLLMVLAFRRSEASQFQAGLLFGLGMFRFQILFAMLGLFLLWRMWRFIAGCFLSATAVAVMSIVVSGLKSQFRYLALLKQMASLSAIDPLIARMPNLRGLMLSAGFGAASVAIVSLLIFSFTAWKGAQLRTEKQFLVAISAACLVTPYLFLHDLSVLALPLTMAVESEVRGHNWRALALVSIPFVLLGALWLAGGAFYVAAIGSLTFLSAQLMFAKERKMC
jgi:hypothetical protein